MPKDPSVQHGTVPCGMYRTTRPIGDDIPARCLVFYHNHGDPGPGVYLPRSWLRNRAVFHDNGVTVPDEDYAESLEPLLPEGLYSVRAEFFCCDKQCQKYEEDLLVQLGYNAEAEPILFIPSLVDGELTFPETGTIVEPWKLDRLRRLKVAEEEPAREDLN